MSHDDIMKCIAVWAILTKHSVNLHKSLGLSLAATVISKKVQCFSVAKLSLSSVSSANACMKIIKLVNFVKKKMFILSTKRRVRACKFGEDPKAGRGRAPGDQGRDLPYDSTRTATTIIR